MPTAARRRHSRSRSSRGRASTASRMNSSSRARTLHGNTHENALHVGRRYLPGPHERRRHRGDRGGVEAAAELGPDRADGTQPAPDGFGEQLAKPVLVLDGIGELEPGHRTVAASSATGAVRSRRSPARVLPAAGARPGSPSRSCSRPTRSGTRRGGRRPVSGVRRGARLPGAARSRSRSTRRRPSSTTA